jgi:F0F1-type ATP synthase membrane subunit a
MLKKPETLFVLGYMLLPLLALLSAIVGLTMILGGNKISGAIVLVVVTQMFSFGAIFALRRRKVALLPQHDADHGTMPDGEQHR